MRVTIDKAGRIVVPKQVRDAMGLRPGQELELNLYDGRIEIEPPVTKMRLEARDHGVVAIADREMPPLTQKMVRETLERVRNKE